jgi:hypothetical protein
LTDIQRAIQTRLQEVKKPEIRWHIIVNNHASTRPQACGGKLCESVTQCKQFDRRGAMHRCLLTLPNSYAADDGKEVCAAGFADNKKEADENACCAVFAILCSDLRGGLPQVILRSSHYNVSPQELVDDIVGIINGDGPGSGPSATVPPLAEHHAASGATFAGTLQDVPVADKERAAEVIRLILQSHGGGFFPNKINHKKFEEVAGKQQVKAHAQLGRLLPLNSLRPFIQPHPEFDSEYKEGRLYIKWQSQTSEADPWSGWQTSVAAASGASSASASAAHPAAVSPTRENTPPKGGRKTTPKGSPKETAPPKTRKQKRRPRQKEKQKPKDKAAEVSPFQSQVPPW